MEDYEKEAFESAALKPHCWFHYVDDTFIIWLHGQEKLKDFLHHLNSIHQPIQFTVETRSKGHLPIMYTDIYRRPDGCLGHIVYHKPPPTHTHTHQSLPQRQVPSSSI
jgi:hypothetical protein